MRKILSGLLLTGLLTAGFRLAPAPQFRQQLAAGHLQFTAPAGWEETPVIANDDMAYDYALRYPGRRLEVRYAVRPLRQLLADYARSKKQRGTVMVDPNTVYESLFHTVRFNVGPGTPPGQTTEQAVAAEFGQEIQAFPPQAVRAEFGADWGGTATFQPRSSFAQDYQSCLLVALHKRNAADVYCFYLFDDPADLTAVVFNDASKAAFHSLRFQ